MFNIAGKLKHSVEVYGRTNKIIDEAGSVRFEYGKIKNIWCMITPIVGERRRAIFTDSMGDMKYSSLTMKFTCRMNAVTVQPDMYLMYKGQRYDVDYSIPYFKDMAYMEIYAQLKIENDDNILQTEGGTWGCL